MDMPGDRFKMACTGLYSSGSCFLVSKSLTRLTGVVPSPPQDMETPFTLITNSSTDAKIMQRLDRDPTVIMLSDWDHFTSEEYKAASLAANLDLLLV